MATAPVAPDTGPDLEAEAGARVLGGRYVLLELLCHGDLGGVYLGRDRVQNRSIEVKLLSPGAAESTTTVAYLRSRARRMFGIRHAHIASVYDEALDEDGVPFFVTEHVEGRNLHHMQGDARLTGAAVQAIALQLAEGLAALHARSVVHGAITPGNIVWIEDDTRPVQIKLVDREVSPGNAESGGYRSPGTAPDAQPDEAGDLYALGAVVYELCTGRLPWSDPDSEPRVRGEDVPITVTEAFEAILLDLLKPDPTARNAGAKALCERLTTVVGPPPPRPAPPRSEPAGQPADEFAAFADEWLDANSADAELTRFRPVEDGPAPAAPNPAASEPAPPPDLTPEPQPEPPAQSLSSAEYTELGPADLAEVSVSALAAAPLLASVSSTSSASSTSALASSSSALNSAIAASNAALTGPADAPTRDLDSALTPMEPRSFVVREPRVAPPVTPAPAPVEEPRIAAPKAPWRLIAAIVLGALLLIVIWQLSRGGTPGEVPVDAPTATPGAAPTAPVTTARAGTPERPADTTLARAVDPAPLPTPEPAPAPTSEPAEEPTPAVADGEPPEHLSAGEFRKVMLRANRLNSTRTCYRRHSGDSDHAVEVIAIVGADGRMQKFLKLERSPLGDCLRKVMLGLKFSSAQKTAQHNFVFHHPDVNQSG